MSYVTEKLYYKDSCIRIFYAVVTECMPNDDGYYRVALNRTAFYPEGGGQPSDKGTINGMVVYDVQEKNGCIYHTLSQPFAVGAEVTGELDWDSRYNLMQHHTGEHIVSGIINRLYGYNNVGFHMGSSCTTIDFDGVLTDDEVADAERLANSAVYKNIPVSACFPAPDALSSMQYRSKKELTGAVRIVTVDGYDTCACCGTHTAMTGEVGIIKLLNPTKYKGGTRISLLCGYAALADYSAKNKSVSSISALLSAKPESIVGSVSQMLDENNNLRYQLNAARLKLLDERASHISCDEDKLCIFEQGLSPAELRHFCMALCQRFSVVLALSGDDDNGYKYTLGVNPPADAAQLARSLNSALCGRGGGTKEMAQGSLRATVQEIRSYFDSL